MRGLLGRFLQKPFSKKPGFTLIEAMTIIAIAGILLSISIYTISQAQRQARDTARKSDLTAIAVSFQARYEAQTCDSDAKAHYPGWQNYDATAGWQSVSQLSGYVDGCGAFSEFLSTIPTDPRYDSTFPYSYNLSLLPATGKHFRLKAKLERTITPEEAAETCRMSQVWVSTYGGAIYDGCAAVGALPNTTSTPILLSQARDIRECAGANCDAVGNEDEADDEIGNGNEEDNGGGNNAADETILYNYFIGQ